MRSGVPIDWPRRLARWGIAIFFLAGAYGHFLLTDFFVAIVPAWLPAPRLLVYISGAAELAGAIGMLWPGTRRAAGIGLLLLIVAVFPANVNMALHSARFDTFPAWALWLRLPLQLVLLAWVWFAMKLPAGKA